MIYARPEGLILRLTSLQLQRLQYHRLWTTEEKHGAECSNIIWNGILEFNVPLDTV